VEDSNVADRRSVQERLLAAEARLRMLVDDAADGIFITDENGRYVDVNAAGCAAFGFTREEMLARSIVDILAPEEHARLGGEIARMRDGTPVRSEWRFVRKDGSTFSGEINGRRLPDQN
jgi:PAS domain S-box-containing protein